MELATKAATVYVASYRIMASAKKYLPIMQPGAKCESRVRRIKTQIAQTVKTLLLFLWCTLSECKSWFPVSDKKVAQ